MPHIIPYNGKYPQIADSCFIAENAVIIGDVHIGANSSIWYGCVIRGDVNYIKIGSGTNIQDGTIVHVNRDDGPTTIGDNVTVGHGALLHGCTLHDNCFVGMGAKVIDFCTIESNGMIGAGGMLTPKKTIESAQLWIGSPAKFSREMRQEEIDYIDISAKNYITLAKEYLAQR